MPYGIIKVDQVTFTNAGVDQTISVSGIVASISGNITATGTISGNVIRGGTTVSGATVTGSAGQFGTITGNTAGFTTVTGTTVTGTTATFTSGVFTNISGGTHTITSGVFASGTAANPSITFQGDVNTGIYSPGADQVAISTNGTGRLFVDSSGRVGIGGSPSTALHLGGSSSQTIRINSNTSAGFVGTTGYITQIAANRNPIDGSIVNTGTATAFINLEADVSNGNIQFCTTGTNNASALERMRITSGGLVGIGTSAPTSFTTIKQSANSAAGGLAIEASGTDSRLISYFDSGQDAWLLNATYGSSGAYKPISFLTSDVRRLTIDTSGRVGIGSTTPRALLDVGGSTAFNAGTYQAPKFAVSNGYIGIKSDAADGVSRLTLIGDSATGDATIDWGGNANANLIFSNNGSNRARIDSSGRLLVGTSTSPSAGALTQYANFVARGNTGGPGFAGIITVGRGEAATSITSGEEIGYLTFSDLTGNEFATIHCAADANAGAGDYPGRLVFSTTADGASSPTERMRIDNVGRIGVNGANSTQQFAITHNGRDGLAIADTNGSSSQTNLLFSNTRAGGTTNYYILGYANAVNTFIVYSNGNVQNTNNSYGAISDLKLKENIVDSTSQWDDIKALQVRKYNFKEGQTHTQIGLIAQEVELVSPGLVSESPDRDEDGNDLGTVTKSVNYSVLYMKAVKALQEAMERIEQLEAKVAALEAA